MKFIRGDILLNKFSDHMILIVSLERGYCLQYGILIDDQYYISAYDKEIEDNFVKVGNIL